MSGRSWMSAVTNMESGEDSSWAEADLAELAAVRDAVVSLAQRAALPGDDGWHPEADSLHRAIAQLVLGRFQDPLAGQGSSVGWSARADVIIGAFGAVWGGAVAREVAPRLPSGPMEPADFARHVRDVASASRAATGHPLFAFAAEDASYQQLAAFLEAKTLTDMNFVNFLSLLMPGADAAGRRNGSESLG